MPEISDEDFELLQSAQINFNNLENQYPIVRQHPLWHVAKAQLAEGLGGPTIEQSIQSEEEPNEPRENENRGGTNSRSDR